jgi:Flp pilus assembly protein TadD
MLGAIFLAYHNSLTGPFILDDERCIINNPHIRQLWPLTKPLANTSRPIVQLSLALNFALGGLDVAGYHVVNLLLHAGAALALFGLVRRSVGRIRMAGEADELGFSIALLWAIHPLVTQPVNYVIQRGELLMSLFLLLTLYGLCRGRLVFGVVACALGMASKPTMAITPVIALLYDRAFMAGGFRTALRQRTGFYFALASTWLVLPLVLLNGQQDWLGSAGFGVQGVAPWQYALTQPSVILHYLRLAIWPQGLCLDYMWPPARSFAEAWLPISLIVGLLALTGWMCWRQPQFGFLAAAFFIVLAPTSSVLPIDDLAFEHRMYLPLACVVAIGVVGWRGVAGQLSRNSAALDQTVLLVTALGLGVLTFNRNKDYRDEVSIWTDTAEKAPDNYRAHNNLANALDEAGAVDEALTHAGDAVRLEPGNPKPQYNLANVLDEAGRTREAIRHYEAALRLNPDYAKAHNKLGILLLREGRFDEAIQHFETALRLQPDLTEAAYYWGVALVKRGDKQPALDKFTMAIQIKPDFVEGYIGRGMALVELDRAADAIADFEIAVRLRPNSAKAHKQLGHALQRLGRQGEADVHLQMAARLSAPAPNR